MSPLRWPSCRRKPLEEPGRANDISSAEAHSGSKTPVGRDNGHRFISLSGDGGNGVISLSGCMHDLHRVSDALLNTSPGRPLQHQHDRAGQ